LCRSHDLGRNLESVRVEGLATSQACAGVIPAASVLPAGSRKVSSQWHPDWRLQTKVAEPGRITTSIYNGQPDPFNGNAIASCAPAGAVLPDGKPIVVLCKQVQQATTDADGSQGFSATVQAGVANRVQQWTYNQVGQVLSERDALNNQTTYAYHPATTADVTQGDLMSVTNARGHVTSYTKYNRHGQLLESSDPNGVPTVNTYDLRQRLTSTSVGGQSTGYSYDAAGQLTRITQADGSWVGYEYDAAQRQTAVLDNRGNRIDYTLDNAGNKTAEQVKDPGGALRRQLTRSFDALGRVQQTTGRE
jgi:YD repeat-containing protein